MWTCSRRANFALQSDSGDVLDFDQKLCELEIFNQSGAGDHRTKSQTSGTSEVERFHCSYNSSRICLGLPTFSKWEVN